MPVPFHTVHVEETQSHLRSVRVLVALYLRPRYPKNCCSGAISQMFPHWSLWFFLTVPVPWGFQQDIPCSSGHPIPLLTHKRTAAGNLPYGYPQRGSFYSCLCTPTAPLEGNHTLGSCCTFGLLLQGWPQPVSWQGLYFPRPAQVFSLPRVHISPSSAPICMHVSDPAVLTMCCSG